MLAQWRCAVLQALAEQLIQVHAEVGGDDLEVVECHRRISSNYDDLSSPWLIMTGVLANRCDWSCLNRWAFTAQVSMQTPGSEILVPVGRLSGWYLNVLGEDGYIDDRLLLSQLEEGSEALLEAWKHVKTHFRDALGFISVNNPIP